MRDKRTTIAVVVAAIIFGIVAGVLCTLASMIETNDSSDPLRSLIERRDTWENDWRDWRQDNGIGN